MELRHLLYFKTVADELHFRNAANKLFISQPPLSRQIKELEEELGARLFDRNNKRVALTDAGKYLKKEVEQLFARLEENKQLVKQIHEGISGSLRIGFISSTYHIHLINVLKELPGLFPFVKTKLYELPTAKQIKALEAGKLDIGIMRTPVESEQLKLVSLFHDPFVLVVPAEMVVPGEKSHELNTARRFKALPLTQLGEELRSRPFIFFNRDYAPEYHRKLMEICQRMGFSPDIVHEANNVHSILRLVESGLGVSIVPRSLKEQYAFLALSFIELPEMPVSTEIVLAYKAQNAHPAVDWFIKEYVKF